MRPAHAVPVVAVLALTPVTPSRAATPQWTWRSSGPVEFQVARTHILLGQHERALDLLEPMLRIAFYLSPRWLRVDPTFDPLRGNPRFERLALG